MNAFFIAQLNIKDPVKFQDYAKGAGESMQPFGGKVITKGKMSRQLAGKSDYQNVAIVGFPDKESLDGWFESEAYQKLIPLRDQAADILLVSYDAAG